MITEQTDVRNYYENSSSGLHLIVIALPFRRGIVFRNNTMGGECSFFRVLKPHSKLWFDDKVKMARKKQKENPVECTGECKDEKGIEKIKRLYLSLEVR